MPNLIWFAYGVALNTFTFNRPRCDSSISSTKLTLVRLQQTVCCAALSCALSTEVEPELHDELVTTRPKNGVRRRH